jgi:hypothetical protein
MAKARHVGTPHSWQLVFGSSLKMSIPDRAIIYLLCKNRVPGFKVSREKQNADFGMQIVE